MDDDDDESFTPSKCALDFGNCSLIIQYTVNSTQKIRRRVIPVRHLKSEEK